jgi:PPE-repeat protein
MRTFGIMMSALALGACARLPLVTPNVQSDWDRTLYYARKDVEGGNYFAADRLLDEYVRVHPDSWEAKEIAFWKAVYTLDPANERGSLASGIAALDQYIASTDSAGLYRNEAIVLRRTAAAAQGLTGGTGTGPPGALSPGSGTDTVVVVRRTREEEIAALKDQLAKTKEELAKVSAELDRIKKRLANPRN